MDKTPLSWNLQIIERCYHNVISGRIFSIELFSYLPNLVVILCFRVRTELLVKAHLNMNGTMKTFTLLEHYLCHFLFLDVFRGYESQIFLKLKSGQYLEVTKVWIKN